MKVKVKIDADFMPVEDIVQLGEARKYAEINCPHNICTECQIGVKINTDNRHDINKCINCGKTYSNTKYYRDSPFYNIE